MIWAGDGINEFMRCRISGDIVATVYQSLGVRWFADIEDVNEYEIAELGGFDAESAAKAAVAAWIGKTIAQLGNALAAGEPRVDEE